MDKQLAEDLAKEILALQDTPNEDGATFSIEIDERTVELTCAARSPIATLTLSPVTDEAADVDLAWAWLRSTWLRRMHDGVVATADADGRLGLGLVLPCRGLSAERAEKALALLDRSSRPAPTGGTDTSNLDADFVWIRI